MFIGQGPGSKEAGSTGGMKQSEQKKVLADFCEGKFNVLVATCIAEEGLDIPQVQAMLCKPLPHAMDNSLQPASAHSRIACHVCHAACACNYDDVLSRLADTLAWTFCQTVAPVPVGEPTPLSMASPSAAAREYALF